MSLSSSTPSPGGSSPGGTVGWQVRRTAHARFVLDTQEQAPHERRPIHRGGLVHHSDRGSQYVSIKYTERLAKAGIEPSVGSVGDSDDNALAVRTLLDPACDSRHPGVQVGAEKWSLGLTKECRSTPRHTLGRI